VRIINQNRNFYIEADYSEAVKRSELKDSDFLFPENRSYPITSKKSILNAIHDFGRGKHGLTYEQFIKKLYNFVKRKHPEWLSAFPDSTLEKVGIKKSNK